MYCAWAATRDAELVEHIELFDADSDHWLSSKKSRLNEYDTGVLAKRSRLLKEAGHEPLPSVGATLIHLQRQAARGTLTVRGQLCDRGAAQSIPADAWANLRIVTSSITARFEARPLHQPSSSPWWSNLAVLPEEVKRVWPSASAPIRRAPATEDTTVGTARDANEASAGPGADKGGMRLDRTDDQRRTQPEVPSIEHEDDEQGDAAALQAWQQSEVNAWYQTDYVPFVQHYFAKARPGRDDDVAMARTVNRIKRFAKLREKVYAARAKHGARGWKLGGSKVRTNKIFDKFLIEWTGAYNTMSTEAQ